MKRTAAVLVLVLVFGLPMVALAAGTTTTSSSSTVAVPTVVVDPSGGIDVISQAIDLARKAFRSRAWTLIAAAVLTLFVVGLRLFKSIQRVPDELVPWVTMAIATGTSMALGLQAGQSWMTVLSTGVLVGVAAIGGWETFGKLVRGLIQRLRTSSSPSAPPAPPPAAPGTPPAGTPPPAGG